MVVIHFKDGSDVQIASGIDAGPWQNGAIVDDAFIQIVNSSQRVALVPTAEVKYLEILN